MGPAEQVRAATLQLCTQAREGRHAADQPRARAHRRGEDCALHIPARPCVRVHVRLCLSDSFLLSVFAKRT